VREVGATLIAVTVQGLSMAAITQDRLKLILDEIATIFIDCIARDTDAEILSSFLVSFTSSFSSLPGCLSPLARQNFIKAIESQLVLLQNRQRERAVELEDVDDRLEYEDVSGVDAEVFGMLGRALGGLMKNDPITFPVEPILSFLSIMNQEQGSSRAAILFTLRVVYCLIQYIPEGAEFVKVHLPRVLALLLDGGQFNPFPCSVQLTDMRCIDSDTRGHAASVVAIAVTTSPVALADFAIAAVEPLFQSIGPIDIGKRSLLFKSKSRSASFTEQFSSDDNEKLAARDNALSARKSIVFPLFDHWTKTRMMMTD
jgi:hypothetical protein